MASAAANKKPPVELPDCPLPFFLQPVIDSPRLTTPLLLALRTTCRAGRAAVDGACHWRLLLSALNASNTYNLSGWDNEPFIISPAFLEAEAARAAEDGEHVGEGGEMRENLDSFSAQSVARRDPRIQPTFAALPPLQQCALLLPFCRSMVARLQKHFDLDGGWNVSEWGPTRRHRWDPPDGEPLSPFPRAANSNVGVVADRAMRLFGAPGTRGSARFNLMMMFVELGVAARDLCGSGNGGYAPYYFRDDCACCGEHESCFKPGHHPYHHPRANACASASILRLSFPRSERRSAQLTQCAEKSAQL